MVCYQSASSDGPLVADLCVRGVWIPQSEVMIDVCVADTDTDAQSYCGCPPLRSCT